MKKLLFVCLSWMLGISQVSAQDATSPYLQLLLMGTGLHIDDWGAKNNTNLLTLENAGSEMLASSATTNRHAAIPITVPQEIRHPVSACACGIATTAG